jgi:hypothetical protein
MTLGYFVTKAKAIIGRPMTPMSYAGVARRTTRREVYAAPAYGAAAGAAAAGVAATGAAVGAAAAYGAGAGARCVQVVDVYGRLVTQCY